MKNKNRQKQKDSELDKVKLGYKIARLEALIAAN